MASVRSLDGALDFEPRSPAVRGFFRSLAVYWTAIGEGTAAAHAYETLTRQGVPHEEAVAQVFEQHFDHR